MRSFVSVLFSMTLALPIRADDWPQFLGPKRDGVSGEKGLADAWPKGGPPRLWAREVGSGYAGPVVAGDRLIVFHRVGDKETIDCLDPATGEPKWSFAYPCDYRDDFGKGNGPRATPSIAADRVITYGADGVLTCLNLSDGTKVWQRALRDDYRVPKSFFGVGSSPLVHEGRVLVNVGGKEAGVVAFSLADGKELWRATRDAASYASPTLTTVAGMPRALFFTREGAVILDPKTGDVLFQKRWRSRSEASVNAATPLVLDDGRAFFSSSYETGGLLLKLTPKGANEVWTDDECMSNHYSTCVAYRGKLYGCDGRQESGARLRCVDPDGPKTLWTKDGFGCASFILAGDRLLALNEQGELILIDPTPDGYRELARAEILSRGPIRAQPALSNGRLFARDERTLVAFDLRKKSK